jgi:signal-transduction protein with cAMP-binding, CBS, and nucleotidyltransferase domain
MDSREQSIDDIMTEPVRSVPPETPAREVATVLLEEGIGSVIVGDASGIVTKTDLLTGIEQRRLEAPVSELMTTPVVTVSRDGDVQAAIDRMNEYEIKRLVVEGGNEAVGIVTTTDIRKALATDIDSTIGLFDVSADTDGDDTYECISCGTRVTAGSKPGTCRSCGAPMRNISVPRN